MSFIDVALIGSYFFFGEITALVALDAGLTNRGIVGFLFCWLAWPLVWAFNSKEIFGENDGAEKGERE